jgi:sugar lactone lactonase YvrE
VYKRQIFGGLGGVPTENEAVLFEWDVDNAKVAYQTKPVPGAMAITGLMVGPDGHLWGFADGTLFVYDVAQRKVIRTKEFYQLTARPSHIWRNAFMKIHPDGNIYVCVQRKLYRVNPTSLDFEILGDGFDLLTMDDEGTLYFKNSLNLYKYTPAK